MPGSRTPAIIDTNPQKHFQQMQSLGYIPPEYKSWDEVEGAFIDLTVGGGMSDKEAAEVMGVDYRNVIGKGYLKMELSSQGNLRGLDKRSLREDIKPDEEAVLRQKLGDDGFKAYQRQRALEWGDVKPTKKDAEIIQAFTGRDPSQFVSTKVEADQVRDRLHGAFGNGGRGAQVHRGHGNSALEGASVGRNNLWPEWGPLNVGHGSAPRYDKGVMRNNNMSANDLQNYYDDILNKEGLNINPVAYHGTGLAADESLRELERPEVTGRRNSMGNPQTTAPVEPGRVSQDSIEWRNRRLYEYEQQIAADAVRRGMDPEVAQALARQRTQELAFNQSGLTDLTQSRGGPVRQIQAPRSAPSQVGTVDSGPKLDPAGRLQIDRSGQVKRDTRPLMQGDIGTISKPQPAPTKPVVLTINKPPAAQTAKAAAGVAPPPRSSLSIRGARGALAVVPFVPAMLGIAESAQAARRGNYKEAGGILAETAVGEVPIIGDTFQSSPVADGTLQAAKIRAAQPQAKPNGFVRTVNSIDKVLTNPGNELRYFGGQLLNKLGIRK